MHFLILALLGSFPAPARAAGYALHGTFLDYGSARARLPAPRRVPAVLYVSLRGRIARLRLIAPGASCLPELGASHYVGPAHGEGADTLAIHVDQKSECLHVSDDARLFLRFHDDHSRAVVEAELTDHVRGAESPVLFLAD